MGRLKQSAFILFVPLIIISLTGCTLSTKTTSDAGIFYSQDQGENWSQRIFVEQQKKKTITLGAQNCHFFVFHPAEENIVYASMENGLYKSLNKGEDWDRVTSLPANVSSFIIDPETNEIQYASSGRNIYKSTNNGETWAQVYIDRPGVSVNALAMHKNATNKIWAGNSDGSILLSEDYGNTWTSTTLLSESITRLVISEPSASTMYALMTKAGFAKSTNGGATWDEEAVRAALKDDYKTGLPFHSFYLRPGTTGDIVVASQYGILRSTNGGEMWNAIPSVIPYDTTSINAVVLHPTNELKVFFTASNVFYASDDGGETWKTLQTIPTSHLASRLVLNPLNPNDLYIGITKIQKK